MWSITSTEAAAILGCTPANVHMLRRAGKLRIVALLRGQRCRGGVRPLYDRRRVWRLKANGYGGAT